jgi:hypothetical protein
MKAYKNAKTSVYTKFIFSENAKFPVFPEREIFANN